LRTLPCRYTRWLFLSSAVPFYAIVLLVVADLMLWRWLYLVGLTLQGLGEINRKSQLEILVVCVRLTAAMLLFALPKSQHQVRSWLLIYFGAALLAAGGCLAWSLRRWGKPGNLRLPALAELKEGLWFVASPSTQTINNDADKLLLARMASLSAAGIYGAAYRVISASFLPVQALLTLTYPRFFRHGGRGLRQSTRFAIRWLPLGLGYSIAAGILLFAGAPLIVKILGSGYMQTAIVIRQLSVLPMMKTFHAKYRVQRRAKISKWHNAAYRCARKSRKTHRARHRLRHRIKAHAVRVGPIRTKS
jgi:O-antigen/teichoic acid export membrane protein